MAQLEPMARTWSENSQRLRPRSPTQTDSGSLELDPSLLHPHTLLINN